MSANKDNLVIPLKSEGIIRALVERLQQDMSHLQTAIIRENKHDVGVHIENINGRLNELAGRVKGFDSSLVGGAQ